MKKILGMLFILLLSGCSSPGKPNPFYTWTQYRTDVNILLVNEPTYKYGFPGTLRLDDKGDYAVMVIYNGGSVSSHFGYVTRSNLEDWIKLYSDFLAWDPKSSATTPKFTIPDNLSLFHKDYDVEYRVIRGQKLFVINKHSTGDWFVDFSELSMDEKNVMQLREVYVYLREKLK